MKIILKILILRSFSEWLSVMNGLDSDHQVKAALHEILLKTARYQMQHGMDENNVLAAFNDLNMTQGIREQVQNQQHQAASKIQNAWRLFNQQRQDEYEVINPQRPGFLARIFSHRSTESSEAPSSRKQHLGGAKSPENDIKTNSLSSF